MVVESIHQRIKRLREARGLSQEALANLAGVKYQSVQEWEQEDGTAPSRKRQAAVADALGVSVSELMTGNEASSQLPAEVDLTMDERALVVRYRAADPRWQLSLRLLAALATEDQIEAATDVNVIIARIMGKKPAEVRYATNESVLAAFGKAPHVGKSPTHELANVRERTAEYKKPQTRGNKTKVSKK